MNEIKHAPLSERFTSQNYNSEFGRDFIGLFRRTLLSSWFSQRCKPYHFSSQLYDIHYLDPFVAGDHAEIMSTFLEKSLLSTVRDEAAVSGLLCRGQTVLDGSDKDVESGDENAHLVVTQSDLSTSNAMIKERDALRVIKPCVNLGKKKIELFKALDQDLQIVDFKISLYITACNNVRLKPFPDHVVEESPAGMQGLTLINDLIPPVKVLKRFLEKRSSLQLNEQVIDVVHWLVVQLRQPKLVELPHENYDSVFNRVEYVTNVQNPTHIFKIMVNNLSTNHLQWQAARGKHSTKFAFYGARVEHIHSLIHLGLYPFQKVSGPLGTGIYLTSDLASCLERSPPSWVWGKSTMGTQLQTVTVVEFIANNPKVVCYRDRNKSISLETASLGKPYHYYVPYNNLIQTRYILVFVKDTHLIENEALQLLIKQKETKDTWKRVLLIGSYLALCFASWKSLKYVYHANIWYVLTEKLKNVHYLKPFATFVQPPTIL